MKYDSARSDSRQNDSKRLTKLNSIRLPQKRLNGNSDSTKSLCSKALIISWMRDQKYDLNEAIHKVRLNWELDSTTWSNSQERLNNGKQWNTTPWINGSQQTFPKEATHIVSLDWQVVNWWSKRILYDSTGRARLHKTTQMEATHGVRLRSIASFVDST